MEEIGRRLRTAREAREISLQRAEEETKIRRKYLEALESGREADLPGDVYLKGFLRTYGNYLGLDGTALVEAYKEWKQAESAQETAGHHGHSAHGGHAHGGHGHSGHSADAAQGHTAPRTRAAAELAAAKPVEHKPVEHKPVEQKPVVPKPAMARPASARQQASQTPAPEAARLGRRKDGASWIYSRQAGWAVLGVVVAGVIFYGGYRILSQVGDQPATQPAPAVVNPAPQPQPTPTPAPEPPKVTMTTGQTGEYKFDVPFPEVQVKFEIGGAGVWLNATADGKQLFDATTKEAKEFKGRDVKVRAGHMEGVTLVVNGQRFTQPFPQAPSYVFTFTATK